VLIGIGDAFGVASSALSGTGTQEESLTPIQKAG